MYDIVRRDLNSLLHCDVSLPAAQWAGEARDESMEGGSG